MKEKLFPQKERYLLHYKLRELYDGECDIEEFSFSFLELGKINKTLEESRTMIEKWAYFFKNAPETTLGDLKKITHSCPPMKRAFQALSEYNYSREELLEYHRYAMKADEIVNGKAKARQEGRDEGLLEGEANGEAKAVRKIVMGLHQQGIDPKIIAIAVKFSVKEVEQMITEEADEV
jgi:predicted transposase/invertase (TIGR01784 family)